MPDDRVPTADAGAAATPFRVTFVTGVMPDKWAARWRRREPSELLLVPVGEAEQLDEVRAGTAAMALVRLPVDRDGLHLIPLYTEDVVVLAARDHPAAAFDSLTVNDLADEHLLQDPDEVPPWRDVATEIAESRRHPVPPMTLAETVASVAANAGIAFLPRSVARVHHRRDVVAVAVADLPGSQVALVWPVDAEDPRIETFVGVVRGRTERSSRGGGTPASEGRSGRVASGADGGAPQDRRTAKSGGTGRSSGTGRSAGTGRGSGSRRSSGTPRSSGTGRNSGTGRRRRGGGKGR